MYLRNTDKYMHEMKFYETKQVSPMRNFAKLYMTTSVRFVSQEINTKNDLFQPVLNITKILRPKCPLFYKVWNQVPSYVCSKQIFEMVLLHKDEAKVVW